MALEVPEQKPLGTRGFGLSFAQAEAFLPVPERAILHGYKLLELLLAP